MTFGSTPPAPPPRRGLWLLLGLLGAVIVGGGAGWVYFVKVRGPAVSTPAPLGSPAPDAQERVRELEARIAQLEREKAEAETRAADEARTTVEAQAAAGGGTADPAAVELAQEEARRRARAEQEGRQQEELRRLAEEKQAEERRAAEATPSPTPASPAVATPTPVPVPDPHPGRHGGPGARRRPGGDADTRGDSAGDPGRHQRPGPEAAGRDRADGGALPVARPARRPGRVVELRALIDETGRVAEVSVVKVEPRGQGFEEEALRHARTAATGRRPRTASRCGSGWRSRQLRPPEE